MKPFRKLASQNRELMAIQEAVGASLNPLIKQPIVDGVLIKDIAITTAGVSVEHLLGRQPLGWHIADVDADVRVWRTAWDARFLTLDASGSANIAIWIY